MARIVDIARVDHSSGEIQMKRSSEDPNQQSKNLKDIFPMNTIIKAIIHNFYYRLKEILRLENLLLKS